jgi:hypothetical protein
MMTFFCNRTRGTILERIMMKATALTRRINSLAVEKEIIHAIKITVDSRSFSCILIHASVPQSFLVSLSNHVSIP